MLGSTTLSVLVFVLTTLWHPNGSQGGKPNSRLDRSYQLQPIPVINGLPGVQYVPMTALYSGMPAVLVPKQIDVMALQSTPASNVALPPQALLQQQYHEALPTGGDFSSVQEPVLHNVRNSMYPIRKKPTPLYTVKRPAYYNFGRKKIGIPSPYHNQKVSSVSIEPSIDISDQLQQLQGSYSTTTPTPVSTYGPAKVLDHQPGGLHVTTYLRPKSHHPHPHYHPKDYRVYSHMHKGHIHNHFIPPNYPIHKSQYHSSAKPVYHILKPTATSFLGSPNLQYFQLDGKTYPESYSSYVRPDTFSTNHIRFPDGELKKTLLNAYKTHQEEILSSARLTQPLKTHSDLTQAFVKEPGTINNYDASIPVKIPSKKPNKFEVKEILRNADVHFIDGTANDPQQQYNQPQQQYNQPQQQYSHYFQEFDPSKVAYHALSNGQVTNENSLVNGITHGINNNHIDYYDQRDSASTIYSQSTSQDELSSSESVKIPVAIIKGTHTVKGHSTLPVNMQRPEQSTGDKTRQKAFTPSSTSSDWIPMSGKPILTSGSASSSPSSTISSSDANEKYLANLLNLRAKESEPTRIITSNRNIGDIISGKIPEEYSPFKKSGSDIITGKIPFGQNSEVDRRKGSVIDENRNSPLDTSNHVVSSMIKFS